MATVPTLSDGEMLKACVASLLEQDGLYPSEILVVCNSRRVEPACRSVEAHGVRVHYPGTNLGTCKSWNLAMRDAFVNRGYLGCLILNDDVVLTDSGAMIRLSERVRWDRDGLYFAQGMGFSGVCVTAGCWRRVGEFDEGFWPAYFEDNDYHRRAVMAGVHVEDVPMGAVHGVEMPDGRRDHSQSLRRWPEWEKFCANYTFPINNRRYVEKWGGPPGREDYTVPWNGRRPWNTEDEVRRVGGKPPWDP